MNIAPLIREDVNAFFFWKGRVALYTIMKAMGIGPGDEVIVPGYTCVVVPNAVLYTGATPVYADIDEQTFNVTAETVKAVLTERTAAIVVQSTFGLSSDLDPILSVARDAGIPVIDDCTHGLGGTYKGQPNGFVTNASFMSMQWSKPVSTGIGGIALLNDPELAEKVGRYVQQYPRIGLFQDVSLMIQRWVRPIADIDRFHYPALTAYRWLTQRLGVAVGSSSGEEIASIQMPGDYLRRPGKIQRRAFDSGLGKLDVRIQRRARSADYYDRFFSGNTDVQIPIRPDYAVHGMLRYSIRVKDNQSVFRTARNRSIRIGNWFDSPLYPVYGNLSAWNYELGSCPTSEKVAKEIVNLPTDSALSEGQLTALFLSRAG